MPNTVELMILDRIADREQTTPTNLDFTLHDYVDPDAVRDLVNHPAEDIELTVEIADYKVTVSGKQQVQPLNSDSTT